MWMIRPKRIYFLEHFAIVSPLNLCDLDTTNTDRRCFQQNYLGVLFLCRKSTIRKNPGKYAKNYISPEDPRSQKTRRRRSLGGPHPCQARAHHWPRLGGASTPSTPSASLCAYKLPFDLKTEGGSMVFQKEFRSAAATRNQDSDPETPFWHPAGTENLERIIAIVITNESPSTTDVSLVHE